MKQKKLWPIGLVLAMFILWSPNSHAHIVGLGYTFEGNNIVFDALHWHGAHPAAGFLNVNGVDYAFDSVTWDTDEMTGLDGALVNSDYSSFDPDTGVLTALGTFHSVGGGPVNDWLHVTVPNPGTETITLSTVFGPGGLTAWTLDDQIQQIDITQPDPSPVPEPAGMALMGLGLLFLGIAVMRRRLRHGQSF
ncbi:MAG: PEP-CTERM sorting domain-containing protein [Ectothiorhodospiraceae bacterium]|nr:PEP-CTERM sorting domain-containing protein [Ectothiorhodospiraceae bacterium]